MPALTITEPEFQRFRQFIREAAGIELAASKKALVTGRLARRVQATGSQTYGDYLRLLIDGAAPAETQTAIDLLTTNETHFFREQKHFDFLREQALKARRTGRSFRIWSAASSSGEEAYSMAMVLADCLGDTGWEVVGSDISTRVLQKARWGHYPQARARHIPPACLHRYCRKGIGPQTGTLLIDAALRRRVQFLQVNLNEPLPALGSFDMIFLRNVMIYFNGDTKRQIVGRVLSLLRAGGHLCVGHSENLADTGAGVRLLAPSIYLKE